MMPHPIDRDQCPAPRHGRATDYRYGCRCPDAREARRLYQKRYRGGRLAPGYVDATGTRRRLQALIAIGHTQISIGRKLGWSRPCDAVSSVLSRPRVLTRTAEAVARLYPYLAARPGPSEKARSRARREGWATPFMWHDIDRDAAPEPEPEPDVQEVVTDEEEIRRAMIGAHTYRHMRQADRHETARRLAARGFTVGAIARRMNTNSRMIQQLLESDQERQATA